MAGTPARPPSCLVPWRARRGKEHPVRSFRLNPTLPAQPQKDKKEALALGNAAAVIVKAPCRRTAVGRTLSALRARPTRKLSARRNWITRAIPTPTPSRLVFSATANTLALHQKGQSASRANLDRGLHQAVERRAKT